MPELRQNFGRASKLLSFFGFGSDTPYTPAKVLKDQSGLTIHDASEINQNGMPAQEPTRYDEMAEYSPIAAAIKMIVDEAIQTEASCPGTLWIEGGSTTVQTTLTHLLNHTLEMEDVIKSQFHTTIVHGTNIEKLILGPNGVHGWHAIPVQEMKRVVDTDRRLVGWLYTQEEAPIGRHVLAGSARAKGVKADEKLWMPWDFVCARLMGRDRSKEFGTPLLRDILMTYNRLRMAEDAMVSYRLAMQPSRYVFKLDVGTMDVTDVGSLRTRWKNELRGSRNIDPDAMFYNHRYKPWAMDDIVVYPIRKDSNSAIDKLQGDNEIPDIADVEHLYRQLTGVLGIPPEFLGAKTDGQSSWKGNSSLATQDLRFQRTIKTVRQPIILMYDTVCRIHLALIGEDPYETFIVKMSNIAAVEATSQMELVGAQADLAQKLVQMGDAVGLPKDEWVRHIFTRFLPLPRDILDPLLISLAMKSGEAKNGEGAPAGGSPMDASSFEPSQDFGGGGLLDQNGLPTPPDMPSDGGDDAPAPDQDPVESTDTPPDPASAGPAPTPDGPGSLTASIKRIQRAGRLLTESEAVHLYNLRAKHRRKAEVLTEATLVERRKRLCESLDNAKKKLHEDTAASHALRVSIGRVYKAAYGYVPQIFSDDSKSVQKLIESYKSTKDGVYQQLVESEASTATEDHPLVTSYRKMRESRQANPNPQRKIIVDLRQRKLS